ncbi:MAG: 50S ribosomal protein L3 [Arcobacter butzleri]|jgi:large subunit ribosomal protein L3|nr:50S ribosomal protein L3 [Arcobacteraceae bacterium]MDY0365092.1 50S ribosomal protein L3 [Arcobacteraceae bacterium]NLO16936.1 50S ribosomal protein L3 [Aliarcobacter butzleri]
MEFIFEKIGMSRTVSVPSVPVTLLKIVDSKVCEVLENGKALVAYSNGKKTNKPVQGQQKKYSLSKEFNRFATLKTSNTEVGDVDTSALAEGAKVKATFRTKGRGFSGVMKRWNFQGGPKSHGSRFHRRVGSIGNCEFPGRVQPGKKMAGRYGFENVTVSNEIVSFDVASGILVLKGSVSGPNGALGKVRIAK